LVGDRHDPARLTVLSVNQRNQNRSLINAAGIAQTFRTQTSVREGKENKFMTKLFTVLGLLLPAMAYAENAVMLESFEAGIDNASLVTNLGGRPATSPPGVTLSQHTKAGNGDANVTEGAKSLKVVLSGKEKFSTDFQIKLSAEASARIRKAVASPDVARYILRYDVIFPSMTDLTYFNSALFLGDSRDALISAGGKRSMSVALDLLTGLPASGPVTLVIADDFEFKPASKPELPSVAIYIDNIRLVDTYAPGAKPSVHILQSFENTNNPTGGTVNFSDWDDGKSSPRTTFKEYTATGSDDIRVTDGRHALEVVNTNPGFWHADFTIPFNDTKLAEVLHLDQPSSQRPAPEELARYTLRWDITYPELTNEWMNSTFHTTENFLPIIQVRHDKATSQRLTYSITLDQAEWGSWKGMAPVLTFITEGPQKTSNTKVYYDNFRLIDTGDASRSQVVKAEK
jgi:hypothetical protein